LVIPGDTIFQSSFLQQVSNFINSQSALLKNYPVLFYRAVKGSRLLKNLYGGKPQRQRSISIVHSKHSQPPLLEKIDKMSAAQLDPEIHLKQLYPCFLLTYSTLLPLLDVPDLKNITSITRLLNRYSESGNKVYLKSLKKSYNFYDLDYNSDLQNLDRKKR
jgi:hypothetical protein